MLFRRTSPIFAHHQYSNQMTSSSSSSSSSSATLPLVPFSTPFELFDKWLAEAKEAKGEAWPNAMSLATCTKDGLPSNRIVLMQRFQVGRLAWYTNYSSRKGQELEENPRAAAIFYWNKLQRQVRFEGRVEKATAQESDEYFLSRPRESRIASIASKQSQILEGRREQLERDVAEVRERFLDSVGDLDENIDKKNNNETNNNNNNKLDKDDDDKKQKQVQEREVTRPDHLGMYWLYPLRIEFWEEGPSRVHTRNCYEFVAADNDDAASTKGQWKQFMLYP